MGLLRCGRIRIRFMPELMGKFRNNKIIRVLCEKRWPRLFEMSLGCNLWYVERGIRK